MRPLSRFEFAVQTLYWLGTAVFNVVQVQSTDQAGLRAAALSVINLIPLYLGNHLHTAAVWLGIPLEAMRRLHNSAALMVCVQSAIHVIIQLTHHPFSMTDTTSRYGLFALISIAALAILPLVRRWLYEIFLKLHLGIAIFALFAIWRHLRYAIAPPAAYIIACAITLLTTMTYSTCRLVYRNIVFGRPFPKARVKHRENATQIEVSLPRPWKIQAGEYVQIWLPGIGIWSWLESHPSMVTWWDEDSRGHVRVISVLLVARRGLTAKVRLQTRPDVWYNALIDGPYGCPKSLAHYGTVILIASGIGIAATVPLAKQLVTRRRAGTACTKQIKLFWQLEHGQREWVFDWMTDLLELDKHDHILNITLYDTSQRTLGQQSDTDGSHNRMVTHFCEMNIEDSLEEAISRLEGRTIVAVSCDAELRDRAQREVRKAIMDEIEFHDLEFQPW
ncbi:hypothetical protein EV356DRAFT_475375 [Viridothelium virens]|uniref:FAD-binding FR-type domain-containing protein n=1 Tax=Viridothelium virens TaxID=1048519 RepID=A0A6A6GUP6_VIRVR|nr:hypothetical protein EV356DRAFT_475375 [Viridothelium virens]